MPPVKISWWWFWLALTAPLLLTMLSACLVKRVAGSAPDESVSPMVALISAAIGAIACGIMVGLRRGDTVPARIGISVLCSALLFVVCLILGFIGCNVGGYHLTFR